MTIERRGYRKKGVWREPTLYCALHRLSGQIHYIAARFHEGKYEYLLNSRMQDVMDRTHFVGSLSDLIHYAYDLEQSAQNDSQRQFGYVRTVDAKHNLGNEYERIKR